MLRQCSLIRFRTTVVLTAGLWIAAGQGAAPWAQDVDSSSGNETARDPELSLFFQATSEDRREAEAALAQIATHWRDGLTPMVIDMVRLMSPLQSGSAFTGGSAVNLDNPEALGTPAAGSALPSAASAAGSPIRRRLIRFLEKQTGKRFGDDLDRWRVWMWSLPYAPHPDYAAFKGHVYGNVDPRLRNFFAPGVSARVRLDQIDWGGVGPNGIPPLDQPKSIPAGEARYLKDKHVVFGIVINGEARAYPKRILAWHELALDELGGVPLTLVYCTLCGAVIPYDSNVAGKDLTFGTSGLLYRSNKLMFDAETNSLWSSIYGRPVIGPLADFDVELTKLPVVTTTWGEWKRRHPGTTVLSLDTGFDRDYREGAAYRDYFRSDDPMFVVPQTDDRLPNKAEVLVLPFAADVAYRGEGRPLAISAALLQRNPVQQLQHDGKRIVILTSAAGASRVFELQDERFVRWQDELHVVDEAGRVWRVAEDALVTAGGAMRRPRIAAHRVFWFAWYAQYPETVLVR
jgi:hypothetical protein